ncbi:MAG: hypothetical protein NT079_00250 [Candidatus Omnitrophica bacterium]|nr:hypothetical protein [Candidatus Omnitrophota bacterium]
MKSNIRTTLFLFCIGAMLFGSAALIGYFDKPGSVPADIRLTASASPLSVIQSKLFGEDDIPVAKFQTFTTTRNVPVHITLLASGKGKLEYHLLINRDEDGTDRKVVTFHGALIGPLPGVDYYPRTDFTGVDTFLFFVTNKNGKVSNKAEITIVVGLPPADGGPQKE